MSSWPRQGCLSPQSCHHAASAIWAPLGCSGICTAGVWTSRLHHEAHSSGGVGSVPFLLPPQRLAVSASHRLKFKSARRARICLMAPLQGSCLSLTQGPCSGSQSSGLVLVHVSWSAPNAAGAKQSSTAPFPEDSWIWLLSRTNRPL